MKRITLDSNTKQDLLQKFETYLNTAKLSDNRINFSAALTPETNTVEKPTIYISSEAFLKMMLYVQSTPTEIAWHGTVERNTKENYYYIKDVFLYPQTIAAATVQTDQEKYNEWVIDLDDDTANTMRFQGHSHVNFGVSPSGTDLTYYNDILQILPKNDYYIFTIMNKSGDMTWFVYDLEANLVYETKDIDITILGSNSDDILADIKKQKDDYCEKPVTRTYNYGTMYNNYDRYGYPRTVTKTVVTTEQDKELNYYQNRDLPPTSEDIYTDTDDLFNAIDDKFKNSHLILSAPKKNKKGAKK